MDGLTAKAPPDSRIEMFRSNVRSRSASAWDRHCRVRPAALLMAPFTRFQFDVATNKISWQLRPPPGNDDVAVAMADSKQVVSPFFVWVGDVLLLLSLFSSRVPWEKCPANRMGLAAE